MCGATTFNTANQVIQNKDKKHTINIITGVNIPMLVAILLASDYLTFKELTKTALVTGKEEIKTVHIIDH
ncbi:MAG: hypothetical protein RA163_03285 [Arsenophonus sp.]|nr:MAG: hypothetical protein RA163_03285 [Arsenophonus sp.]